MSTPTLEQYAEILGPELGRGFSIGEFVEPGNRRFVLPPTERLMRRMVPTLRLANELRAVMVEKHGAKGLAVHAAYRPHGGAKLSMHKYNRALDLDLFEHDVERLGGVYYEEAVRLWAGNPKLDIGLGLYCPSNVQRGHRVHFDVGGYGHPRTWQHGWNAGVADALLICDRLGLPRPGRHGDDESDDVEPGGGAKDDKASAKLGGPSL